jgi:hypothetical protein
VRVQSYNAGVIKDTDFEIPDRDYHMFVRKNHGYELVYQWGVESLRVSLYQQQDPDKCSPVAKQLIILHIGHETSAVACESVFDTMAYAEGPLRFIHQHLQIYGILFPVSAHPAPGSQI